MVGNGPSYYRPRNFGNYFPFQPQGLTCRYKLTFKGYW